MRVQLLGTGSSDGWPNPWCTCASCTWARAHQPRTQTSALVDDTLLFDCGPDVPKTAARLGVPLANVRHLLLGHAHPDHTGPHALMWRGWSTVRARPLQVVGPPAALAACRPWIARDDPLTLVEVAPGDHLRAQSYDIRVLAAAHGDASVGPAVLYDVTAPDGQRLLYATDTGPLPATTLEAVRDAAFDVVLLEETHGEHPEPSTDHHDLASFAQTCAQLRRRAAVTPATRVIAIHLGHGNPPGSELARRLALLGAEALSDGDVVGVGPLPPPRARRVLVTGGARSGKSAEAERRLAAAPEVVYVATAGPGPTDDPTDDREWAERVGAHRRRRPMGWRTIETADLVALLAATGPPLLVDCLTLWLAADPLDDARVDALVAAWRDTPREVVAVTNEVGSGIVPTTAAGRSFRDALGRLNARLAADSDEVWLVVAGMAQRLR